MNQLAKRLSFVGIATLLVAFVSLSAAAQSAPKQAADPPQTKTTADAWRDAVPQAESQTTVTAAVESGGVDAGGEESFERIEKRLTALEHKWMEAIKLHDTTTLKKFIGEDFTLAGESLTGALSDRTQYLNNTLRDAPIENYSFGKMTVRVYGKTAIVSVSGTRQSLVEGRKAETKFLYTDVWVKEGAARWRVVMRHSELSEAAR